MPDDRRTDGRQAASADRLTTAALDAQLRRRLVEAIARARHLLGELADDPKTAPPTARLRAVTAALVERLVDEEDGGETASAYAAHEAQLERLRRRYADRIDTMDRVAGAISRMREITTPATMLRAAPEALCESSRLERVVVSAIRDGTMVAEAAHFGYDTSAAAAALEALRARPVPLEHPLIETEVLRRRRATAIADARVHPRVDRSMAETMGWRSYIAAPVIVQAHAIAVIHADRGPSLPLDVLDRDVLWEFAAGLAQAYESAHLRRTLRQEREQMRHFLEWVDGRSGALSDAAIELVPAELPQLPAPTSLDAIVPSGGAGDGAALAGVLTSRELEVLELLSEGRTNRSVADELVISNGTVKFHVNSILRKLRVGNRVEAVARYYALLGDSPRE